MRRSEKIIGILISTLLISILQVGCSREKTVDITNDVLKEDFTNKKEKMQIEEKVLDLNADDEREFLPCYWEKDKFIGMREVMGPREKMKDKQGSFYEVTYDGDIKETKRIAKLAMYDNDKGVYWALREKNIYYYDFSNGKVSTTLLLNQNEMFKELYGDEKQSTVGYEIDLNVELVQGNDKYVGAIETKVDEATRKAINFIKLYSLYDKKLYEGEISGDEVIVKIVYVKDLSSFVGIDRSGQSYKINIYDGKLEINKFVKIDIGKGNKIENRPNVDLIEDNIIMIKNIGEVDEYGDLDKPKILMMLYNFKDDKVNNLIKVKKDANIRIEEYFNKHRLAVISKRSSKMKGRGESIYICKVNDKSISCIYKLKDYLEEDELYWWINPIINDDGDKIFIERSIKNSGNKMRSIYEICDIKK